MALQRMQPGSGAGTGGDLGWAGAPRTLTWGHAAASGLIWGRTGDAAEDEEHFVVSSALRARARGVSVYLLRVQKIKRKQKMGLAARGSPGKGCASTATASLPQLPA